MPMPGSRKLGRKPRHFSQKIAYYSAMKMMPAAPFAIPAQKHWTDGMPIDLGMMMNDRLGCCSIAAMHHLRQITTFNSALTEMTDPDPMVLADYERFCGYNPADPSTDQGGMLQAVLNHWLQDGITTPTGPEKLLTFMEVDVRNQEDVKEVIAQCGGAYIGIDLPESWGAANAGAVWDVTSSPIEGGHCVLLSGYDSAGFDVISWGMRFTMTYPAFREFCDECYATVTSSWVEATGLTPAGLSVEQIEHAMASLR